MHAVDGGDAHAEVPPNPSRAPAALGGLAARMSTMGMRSGEPQHLPSDGGDGVAHSVPLRSERVSKPAAASSAARRAAPKKSRMPRRPEWVDVEIPCDAEPDVVQVRLSLPPRPGDSGFGARC